MEIVKIPNPLLKRRLADVASDEIKKGTYAALIEEMRQTMIVAKGVGLAANQIGQDLQLFVIEKVMATENAIPDAFFNPEITEYSREEDEMEEGCLSIPSFYHQIRRAKKIKIKALDEQGNKIKFKARGFLARVLQHETDHLNGVTIKERAKK